jgi:flagellin-like protein
MDSLPYPYLGAYFMRTQEGLSSVEALLILVIIVIIGSVGCSRQEVGKSLGNAGGAWEPRAMQIQQQ